MDITKKLYKISAGLIIGYFLICCFFTAVPKIPLAAASMVTSMSFPEKLPAGAMLLTIAMYSPCLLLAAVALMSLSAPLESAKTRICISGVFVFVSAVLTRVLSYAAGAAVSRSGVENVALMSAITTVISFFSMISTAGTIVLFCALAVDTYEYTRQK